MKTEYLTLRVLLEELDATLTKYLNDDAYALVSLSCYNDTKTGEVYAVIVFSNVIIIKP